MKSGARSRASCEAKATRRASARRLLPRLAMESFDSLGHALIGQNTSGTAEGEIIAKWVDADDQTVGHPFSWRDSPGGMSEHVIGGGLLFNRTTYVPSGGLPQPAPAWFATHAERMMVV